MEIAQKQSVRSGKSIQEVLLEFGFVSSKKFAETLAQYLGLQYVELGDLDGLEAIPDMPLTVKFLRQHRILPLSLTDGVMVLAMADPLDLVVLENIRKAFGFVLDVRISDSAEIERKIEDLYGSGTSSMKMILDDLQEEELEILGSDEDQDVDTLRDMASEAPVIKLVNLLFSQAVEIGASDIHIEPFEGDLHIRFRVDGVLNEQESPPKRLQSAIISRIKILARMNIAEHRLPQDGRIRLRILGKKIDVRVSTVPTMYGESVVMRLLDQTSMFIELEALGFPPDNLTVFKELILHPHGMILVTGPTGSGKTTTLYAALDKINVPGKKILTLEDPVEYQLKGVNQIQVNTKIGLNFSGGLRAFVRQDPDVIMVGEIRDRETAEIAIQSALTGHLVFSTVHTNDAVGAITRLQDMGVENYLIASCLDGVLAQRLVRRICPDCKIPTRPDLRALQELEIDPDPSVESLTVYRGAGCKRCGNTGYRGRMGIYELFVINEEFKQLIVDKASANILKKAARRAGMKTLRDDGWTKVRKGLTSIEEVMRVTQTDDDFGG
ncbi:type II secretion system ATPase GspE [bacterium]|nr:type II secretion system ATPase GspE [candidate division CSSED10-310 bacterium]